ncbi:MAG: YdcF family protein [Runella slithyformis]|nr:MAG: YdcF family protein [Runella slithyformis]
MFYVLSKTIDVLLMPLTLAFIIFLFALFTKYPHRKRRAIIGGLVWLYVISCPLLVDVVLGWWEPARVAPAQVDKNYKVTVILTGGMSKAEMEQPPHHMWAGFSFDRVAQALQLYKAGKMEYILISGGQGRLSGAEKNGNEGRAVRHYLIASGVPANKILLEPNARNTHENAVFSAQILRSTFKTNECLLITSAFHLPRAVACFKKEGIKTTSCPAHFMKQTTPFWFDKLFPNEEKMAHFYLVWHEWLGIAMYKIVGYI